MEQTTTILYDFWQFMFFAAIFAASCAYLSWKRGFQSGAEAMLNDLINRGVLSIEEDEAEDDLY